MDLYTAMEYLTTAACCAAGLAAVVPFADRPPHGQRGGLGDPPVFARMCAILALLCGLPAFAIGVRLFGLAEVLTTLQFKGPAFPVMLVVAFGPALLLSHSQRLEKQRETSRRALEAAANLAEVSYRYDARQFRSALLPFVALVGGGSFYYATLLWESAKRLGPEGALTTKSAYFAASLLLMLVFYVCGKLVYRLLFRLPSIANASGFFVTEKALIKRAGGLGRDQWVPWEAIHSIQSPSRPGEPCEIRHSKGVLRVPAYVSDREALIAVILARSPNLDAPSRQLLDSAGRALPSATVGMRDPLMRFALVALPFLVGLALERSLSPWSAHPVPGYVRMAIPAVPFIILLISARGPTPKEQPALWFQSTLSLVVTLHLGQVIARVLHFP